MARRRGWLAIALLALAVGCSLAPKGFEGLSHPAPLVRARAVGMGRGLSDEVVLPALVDRLEDPDEVVRLTAHDELRHRSGQDFGFVPWADPAERAAAVARWRAWLAKRPGAPAPRP
jgi:HEAT repeat protein